jgi:hypothetical protein
MKHLFTLGAFTASVLVVSSILAGEGLKSGPAVGKSIPGPFDVLNVTGPAAGEKNCQV